MHHLLSAVDRALLEWLHRHSTPAGVTCFLAISRVGEPRAMAVLAVLGAVFLITRREWIVLGGWIAAFGGTTLIDHWLKLAVRRPRPVYATALLHNPSWSFPSGHAMGALIGYGMLAYVFVLLRQPSDRVRRMIYGCTAVLILAIGASRLYLGVHYFTDVAGGYVVGLVWLATCIAAVEITRRWHLAPGFAPKA